METEQLERRRLLLGVALVALLIRLIHNQSLLGDPLYFSPLGGNLPYLLMAEQIANGQLFPSDGAFTVNSPLYPYIVAVLFKVFGVGALYAVRVAGACADAATCALVALLALRHFGPVAAWAAGLAMAFYAPQVFFATELTPVPFTLLLLTASLVILDDASTRRGFLWAGVLLGLATGTRPNVLIVGVLALAVPWTRALGRPRALALAGACGLALGIAPVTVANVLSAKAFVPLTLSAGHNFYIGHNPQAQAQYFLPTSLDGDVFETMKSLAESVEGRPFEPGEVSSYYFRKAAQHLVAEPVTELGLLGRRALLLMNDFEATTYASFDYQRSFSGWLRWGPSFAWLVLLAAPGALLVLGRNRWHLWLPLLGSVATVLLFFYIARLRILMVPSLCVFAGAAVGRSAALLRERAWDALVVAAVIGGVAFAVAHLPLLEPDTSNEWNKAGGVLRLQGRTAEAEVALERAIAENPANPNSYLNLAVLYRQIGRSEDAAEAERRANELAGPEESSSAAFERALRGSGR